jgi:hypothetical protein
MTNITDYTGLVVEVTSWKGTYLSANAEKGWVNQSPTKGSTAESWELLEAPGGGLALRNPNTMKYLSGEIRGGVTLATELHSWETWQSNCSPTTDGSWVFRRDTREGEHHWGYLTPEDGGYNVNMWEVRPSARQDWIVTPVGTPEVRNLTFDNLPALPSGDGEFVAIDSESVSNYSDRILTMTATFRDRIESYHTLEQNTGITASISGTIKGGIPAVAEGELTISAGMSHSWANGKTSVTVFETEKGIEVEVPAMRKTKAQMKFRRSNITAHWTADAVWNVHGKQIIKKISGYCQSTIAHNVDISIKDESLE